MSEKLSLRTNGNGDIYVYIEDSAGASLAFGADSANGVVALNTSGMTNVQPLESTANMTIDPTANGDILFRPHGTGDSYFDTGDVQINAGNLKLPATNSSLTQGAITSASAGSGVFFHTYSSGTESNVFVGDLSGNGSLTPTAINNYTLGRGTLANLTSGGGNIAIGNVSGYNVSIGIHNCLVGYTAGGEVTTGSYNAFFGQNSGRFITTGSYNTILGAFQSGTNCTTSESSNIYIQNTGVLGESNKIRIGTTGAGNAQQNACYIAGVHGVTPGGASQQLMIMDSSGQMGSTAGGAFSTNSFATDSGTATPAAGVITIAGGLNITTSGAASTVTVNVGEIVGVTNSGASTVPYIATGTGQLGTVPGGAVLMNTGTQSLSISSDASATTVAIATGAAAKTVSLGSTNSTSSLALQYGTSDFTLASATGTVMSALDTGEITYPLQPSFYAYLSANVTNVTGDGTVYTIAYNSELYDRNSDFNTGTATFTAPVTGLYWFYHNTYIFQLGVLYTNLTTEIVTTARTYLTGVYNGGAMMRTATADLSVVSGVLALMTAGDTCTTRVTIGGSTKTVDIGGTVNNSFFCGILSA